MNTENNQQSPQDDGILSFDDAISPKDSEKQQENNTEEKATGTTENPSAEETSEHQPEMSDNETADEAVQQEDNLESVAEEEPVITFDSFGFCPEIMQALNEAGFREPTPIQVKAIPSVMEGRDVIGQALTGILMEVNSGEARLVALDGFRLALQVDQRAFDADGLRVVIPGRVMQELGRVLPEEEEDCSLVFGGGHMTATFGKTRLETVLLAGEYIDYKRILPASFATETLVNRSDIQNAIDRASLMAREGKNNLIRMSVNEGTMTISSNAELGDVREELTVATNGNPIEIAFNAKYLTDVIRNVGDDELCMKFNSNVSPCVIVPKEGNAYLFLVLPVRIF